MRSNRTSPTRLGFMGIAAMDFFGPSLYNAPMSPILDSRQRAWLRSQAHHLDPVVHIGTSGLTDSVYKALAEALDFHELVKLRFVSFKEDRRTIASGLESVLDCALVAVVGNTAILYKPAKDPVKAKYRLPPSWAKDQ